MPHAIFYGTGGRGSMGIEKDAYARRLRYLGFMLLKKLRTSSSSKNGYRVFGLQACHQHNTQKTNHRLS